MGRPKALAPRPAVKKKRVTSQLNRSLSSLERVPIDSPQLERDGVMQSTWALTV